MLDTQTIKDRYDKGYITDEQLGRYVALCAITEAQAEEIKGGGSTGPAPEDSIATADLDAAYKEGVNSYE